ncbi:ATP-binding protein [Nonomuraea sp. NN258]|uniref:ATP-binding protein n=1 Tax=Nonomuraea antri TaxID=2730852 RepID=UPI0015691BA5|nr:ATP-binding protein [Nonomuraea antri]NRQ36062.1 ATP-binding protein [Nonomuraea antri]
MSTPSYDNAVERPVSLDLAGLRGLVYEHARRTGLTQARADDLALAVNEAVTNVLDHAEGRGRLRIWADDRALTVDVIDDVGVLDPSHCPDRRPEAKPRGFGLWMMRRLCDEFTVTRSSGSSRVRLRMYRAR